MPTMTDDERASLISEITSHLEAKGVFAPETLSADVQSLQGWRRKAMADGSFGRVFNGAQWLDGVAIRDNAITAQKLKAVLVISNTFTSVDTTLTPTADRFELTSAGFKTYGTISGVPNIVTTWLKTDGSGFVGSTDGTAATAAIGWGAALASGTMRNTVTIGSGGKLAFGAGGLDYLDDNILHFDVGATDEAVVEWKYTAWSAGKPYGSLIGNSSSTTANAQIQSTYDSTHVAYVSDVATATTANATVLAVCGSNNSGVLIQANDTAASNSVQLNAGGRAIATFDYTNRAIHAYGRLYPGPDSGSANTTRYITDDGSNIVASAGFSATTLIASQGTFTTADIVVARLNVATSGASGALPSPTKYLVVQQTAGGATNYYIPVYSNFNGWTA